MVKGERKSEGKTPDDPRPSLLPFDPADLVAMRVRPSQFADMVGVSKQSVSRWIKQGKVNLGPDGRMDPVKAAREVIERTDPTKMRARVFKQAMATHGELQARIVALEGELSTARQEVQAARWAAEDNAAERLARLLDAVRDGFADAMTAQQDGTLGEWLDERAAVDYYGQDLAEYRAELAADDEPEHPGSCPDVPDQS